MELDSKKIEHIIIFGSDSFGSYLIENNDLKNINILKTKGAYSLNSHAVIPTASAINWNSLMRGLSPNLHGYTEWNSFPPEIEPVVKTEYNIPPSLFYLVKKKNPLATTCAFFRWPQWQHIIDLECCDYYYNLIQEEDVSKWGKTPNSTFIEPSDNILINEKIVNQAISYINEHTPYLSLIYVNEPDTTGHYIGHQTSEIDEVVKQIDGWIGKVLTMIETNPKLKDNTLFAFVADHGGFGVGSECHGGINIPEFKVPMFFFGPMVKPQKIIGPLIQYDFTKTLAWKLDLDFPEEWNGRILTEIFVSINETPLVLYKRDIEIYALYHNGQNIFLMLGYDEAIKRAKEYGKEQKLKEFKVFDKNNLLTIVKI